MPDNYEVIGLGGSRSFESKFGTMYANKVTVAGPNGEEEAEIVTKKQGVLKLGDSFEADRQETQYGLKLKRIPPQQGAPQGGTRPAPRPDKPKRSYGEILAAYRQFLADTGEKTHATTLLLSWMRGEFEFEPAQDPDGPPEF